MQTEYERELQTARKERLLRMGAAPHLKAIHDLNEVISEQRQLIADMDEAPDAVTEWVKRQKAINTELRSAIQESVHGRPTVRAILGATARHFNVSTMDLVSARRTAIIVYPRQIVYYLCKTLTLRSLPDIGSQLGGRDHTTILHGVRKIGHLIKCEWQVAYDVAQIEALLS